MPRSSIRYSSTPGSSDPQRVPIGRPSTAVKPIVLATLRPADSAHMLAPLPRCSTTVRPRRPRVELRQHRGDVLVGQAVEAVAAHARGVGELLGSANLRQLGLRCGGRRCRSRPPAAGPGGARAAAGSAQVVRLVQRRQRHELLQVGEHRAVDAHRARILDARRARRGARRRSGVRRRPARAASPAGAPARRRGRAACRRGQACSPSSPPAPLARESRRGVELSRLAAHRRARAHRRCPARRART
jgi:hypothetical protein